MKRLIDKTEYLKMYAVDLNGKCINVAYTVKRADKNDHIECSNGQIEWHEIIPLGFNPVTQMSVICQPQTLLDADCNILIVSGKPGFICGLDEGIIASAISFDGPIDKKKLYVMSECKWKSSFL